METGYHIWLEEPTKVAALDPAFTNGGDRSILFFVLYGQSREGIPTLCYTHYELLRDDVTNKKQTRSEQIVDQMKMLCEAEGVVPENIAFDSSGAGGPFGDVLNLAWSRDPLRIQFGGKASEMPVSATDSTPAYDRYSNRVSELWFSAKELLRNGQLKGIDKELAKEMCARKYTTEKGTSLRMKVEAKPDIKSRSEGEEGRINLMGIQIYLGTRYCSSQLFHAVRWAPPRQLMSKKLGVVVGKFHIE